MIFRDSIYKPCSVLHYKGRQTIKGFIPRQREPFDFSIIYFTI